MNRWSSYLFVEWACRFRSESANFISVPENKFSAVILSFVATMNHSFKILNFSINFCMFYPNRLMVHLCLERVMHKCNQNQNAQIWQANNYEYKPRTAMLAIKTRAQAASKSCSFILRLINTTLWLAKCLSAWVIERASEQPSMLKRWLKCAHKNVPDWCVMRLQSWNLVRSQQIAEAVRYAIASQKRTEWNKDKDKKTVKVLARWRNWYRSNK